MRAIEYTTRDEKGNEVTALVKIKEFPKHNLPIVCASCGETSEIGIRIKDAVSSNFTDWNFFNGEYVCPRCADLFSLYFYSYIVDADGIRILNIREIRDVLTSRQKPPFLICITTSKKKHLFYKAKWGNNADRFPVNLETETIYTTPERMKALFDFVECLQTLGATKTALANGNVPFQVAMKFGQAERKMIFDTLKSELETSREIQIPLFCGQKRNIGEEDAKCFITSTLTALSTQKRR